jgi:hypothetical protein
MLRFLGTRRDMIRIASLLLLFLTALNATRALASDDLGRELQTLNRALAQGQDPAQASEAFIGSLSKDGLTIGEVDHYMRARLSPRDYAEFKDRLEVSIRGIDPATLSGDELDQLTLMALSQLESRGLSWSPCATDLLEGSGLTIAGVLLVHYMVVHQFEQHDLSRPMLYFTTVGGVGALLTGIPTLLSNGCYQLL